MKGFLLFLTLVKLAFKEHMIVSASISNFMDHSLEYQKKLFISCVKNESNNRLEPTVFIPVFVRNKEHSLPYFLDALYNLNHPKSRISLWFVTDHNSDWSSEVLEEWIDNVKSEYHKVELESPDSEWYYDGQSSNLDWTEERHKRMLQLRQEALTKARNEWADYILFIDADNLLMNPYTLCHLFATERLIVSPMYNTLSGYSNFWGGQDENGYYVRSDDYFPIKNREVTGTFKVPMVHSTMLMDLRQSESESIQFWPILDTYQLAIDDIIVFSHHVKKAGLEMYIDNTQFYGYMPVPLNAQYDLPNEVEVFNHLLHEIITEPPVGVGIEVQYSPHITQSSSKTKLGFDEIYMINLVRREDRYYRMKTVLGYQDIDFHHFHAIDAKKMNDSYIEKLGIKMLPGYLDPYKLRVLTKGEIGCFLSHYFIWEDVVANNHQQVIVIEDDVRFEYDFKAKLEAVMNEVDAINLDWDLIYIGRKRMGKQAESYVSGAELLVEADYSYWTLGYLLSLSGAKKLLAGKPLGLMVPVDEYLPIMYDKHPKWEYAKYFANRNLKAFSAEPLLIYPTHYTGQDNHFSDTEAASIVEGFVEPETDQGPSAENEAAAAVNVEKEEL